MLPASNDHRTTGRRGSHDPSLPGQGESRITGRGPFAASLVAAIARPARVPVGRRMGLVIVLAGGELPTDPVGGSARRIELRAPPAAIGEPCRSDAAPMPHRWAWGFGFWVAPTAIRAGRGGSDYGCRVGLGGRSGKGRDGSRARRRNGRHTRLRKTGTAVGSAGIGRKMARRGLWDAMSEEFVLDQMVDVRSSKITSCLSTMT